MKTLFVAMLTLLFAGALLVPDTADARRMGGGKSLGKQYQTPHQTTAPRQQAAPAANAPRPAQAGGMSRWLGPLAGLAAGGLLASLFFGGAFEGFQPMDFIIIALLVIGGVLLFRMLRRRGAAAGGVQARVPAGAAAGYGGHAPGAFGRDLPGGGAAAGASAMTTAGADEAPAWFNPADFVAGAKTHFIRLQAAWDKGDFRDIREYTSPELFAELKREREALGDAPNYTEVVRLDAEMLTVRRDGDRVVASLRFSGLIREEEAGTADPLDEIWHVAHDWASPAGDWQIVGIQQPD